MRLLMDKIRIIIWYGKYLVNIHEWLDLKSAELVQIFHQQLGKSSPPCGLRVIILELDTKFISVSLLKLVP